MTLSPRILITSHLGLNLQSLQKQPLRRLPVLLVSRKNSRNVLRQNYDAKPPLIRRNLAILLSSVHSSILSNFRRPIAILSTKHPFQTLIIQQLQMVACVIQSVQHRNQFENRNLQLHRQSPSRANVKSRRVVQRCNLPL